MKALHDRYLPPGTSVFVSRLTMAGKINSRITTALPSTVSDLNKSESHGCWSLRFVNNTV